MDTEWAGTNSHPPTGCAFGCEVYSRYALSRILGEEQLKEGEPYELKHCGGKLPTGLMVFAGRTSGGKSEFAMSVMWRILELGAYRNRKPVTQHLVTLEDPIEKPFYKPTDEKSMQDLAKEGRVHYTARTLGPSGDCADLKSGFKDALRQTPAIVFVGETRREEDWNEIMRFADTGHLVVTTTHAASVSDTLQKILSAVDARTPEDVARHARNICAIIHVESQKNAKNGNVILPDIWRNTTQSIAALLGDGLGSIVPGNPPQDDWNDSYCFGRKHFCDWLLKNKPAAPKVVFDAMDYDSILAHCLKSDLRVG